MQPEQTTDAVGALEAQAVVRFLSINPEFFEHHQDVLPRLRIPHPSGRAVSLIERQVSVLRARCATLEGNLRELIGVARANERLQHRLHALVQDIISAPSLDVVVACVRRSLRESFGADAVYLLLIEPQAPMPACGGAANAAVVRVAAAHGGRGDTIALVRDSDPGGDTADTDADTDADVGTHGAYRRVAPGDPLLELFDGVFAGNGTRCGLPDAAQLDALAGAGRTSVGSAALVPLHHETPLGLVMLSSRDEACFGAGKGVVFLDQLGQVLSRRLYALRRERP